MAHLTRATRMLSVFALVAAACAEPPAPAVLPSAPVAADVPVAEVAAASLGERIARERAIADVGEAYRPIADEAGFTLRHPGGALATITHAAHLTLAGQEVTLGATSIGRGGALTLLPPGSSVVADRVIELPRGAGIVEWWRSLPSGLEHGVTLAQRPSGEGALVVRVGVSGAQAQAVSDQSVSLRGGRGERLAEYRDLLVVDAEGTELPARLAVTDGSIDIVVDDARAVYPIVVDPFTIVSEATLTIVSGGTGAPVDGPSVAAFSSDGSRLLVGPHRNAGNADTARVYARSGTTWSLEQTLTGSVVTAGDRFGASVAISGDGTRLVVGAPYDDTPASGADAGSVYVFVRSGTTWTEETRLLPALAATTDLFGMGVAISSDGSRVLVGAPQSDVSGTSNAGRIFEFVRTGTTWNAGATITRTTPRVDDCFGWSVAIDGTGSRMIGGAPTCPTSATTNAGRADVYGRSGAAWTLEYSASSGASGRVCSGSDVSMSGDGLVAVYGARGYFSGSGPCAGGDYPHVLYRSGISWLQVTLPGACGGANGHVPAVNRDGAVIGTAGVFGYGVYVRSSPTTWAYDSCGSVPVGSSASGAISGDGSRGAVMYLNEAYVLRLGAPNGNACTVGDQCASGFCADGVCCESACGASAANDCQACAASLTGLANGLCRGLSAGVAPSVVCRPVAGACDVQEVCTAGVLTCPATDIFLGGSTTCRASTGVCDPAEVCSGTSASCPGDSFASAGVECRASTGTCDPAEVCSGSSGVCPTNAFASAGTTCNPSSGACDPAEVCTGSTGTCPPNVLSGPAVTCRPAAGLCDAAEVCSGASAACPADTLLPGGTTCRASAGTCDVTDVCSGTSAACPDAVRPADTECRASAGACDLAERCDGTSGACPGDTLSPVGTVCRASMGGCDLPESCAGGPSCPADNFQTAGVVCRASVGTCDVAEVCPGGGPLCPTDAFATVGTVCNGFLTGPCDTADTCDGMSAACPPRFLSGTECRASAGACDVPEVCAGSSASCPPDVLLANGVQCGGAAGRGCSTPGTCNGATASCPGATLLPIGTPCHPADPANPCDVADVCTGTSDACPSLWAAAGTVCAPAGTDVCAAPDVCTGTSGDCVATALVGVVCRVAAGACDVAETCNGASESCPADGVLAAGVTCRGSTGMSCDPIETCDGTATACPADVSSCGDGGTTTPDAAVTSDAGASVDAGATGSDAAATMPDGGSAPPVVATGCGCRAGGARGETAALGWLFVGLALFARRRRR